MQPGRAATAPAWIYLDLLQEAIRLKERKIATEVLAVTLGPAGMQVGAYPNVEGRL